MKMMKTAEKREPILGYVPKNDEKKNLGHKGLIQSFQKKSSTYQPQWRWWRPQSPPGEFLRQPGGRLRASGLQSWLRTPGSGGTGPTGTAGHRTHLGEGNGHPLGRREVSGKGTSTLATLFNHMWPRIVAGIFIPVGNHYFQALASTVQLVAQVCDRLWLVPATDRAFAYITYMSPPHVDLVCSGPPQCAATCGWTKWPVCSGPKWI